MWQLDELYNGGEQQCSPMGTHVYIWRNAPQDAGGDLGKLRHEDGEQKGDHDVDEEVQRR